MGKALYGKSAIKGKRVRSKDEGGSLWLTLISEIQEADLHRLIVKALSDPLAPRDIPSTVRDSLAASLIEYAAEQKPDCDEAWCGVVQELFSDFGLSLSDDNGDDAVLALEREGALDLVRCFKRHKVLCDEPPPPPPLATGAPVLAVLDEDGDWHEAVFVETKSSAGGVSGPPRIVVRFVEWPKVQETARANVVALNEVADDDGAEETEGQCEMCGRCLKLTCAQSI